MKTPPQTRPGSAAIRSFALLYGVACYALCLATFAYAIGFVAGVAVPRHIDSATIGDDATALLIDVLLLGLFAVQHSGMARPGFKRWWTRIVPEPFERSTYVLLSSLALVLLFWQWRPLPRPLWHVEHEVARFALYGLSGLGWLLVLAGTFTISHLDLFGLRQAWQFGRVAHAGGPGQPFVIRAFYRVVRHPLMFGFLVAFWATPTMSVGHLLFALVTSGYIVLAVKLLEERDLIALYGDTYRDYQRRVPMLLPWPKRPSPAAGAADTGDP